MCFIQHIHDALAVFNCRLCDIAVAGSFTDFRIDAGGATRWYHVFRGSKVSGSMI